MGAGRLWNNLSGAVPNAILGAAPLEGGFAWLAPCQRTPQPADPAPSNRAEAYHQFMLGRLLNGQGETEEAAAAYQRAAELDPTSAEILGELAELYAQQGRVQDAIATAESALELDSASVQGHWVLGNIYVAFAEQPGGGASSGDSPSPARQAIGHLEQARQPLVFNPGLELRLGNLYVQVEDFEAALEILEPLARRTSNSRGVVLGLTDAYAGVGRLDDAVDTLEGLLAEQPFSRGLSRLARLYEMQDRWADAADAYERALQRRPDSRTLKFRLARALLTDGRTASRARSAPVVDRRG